MFIPSRAQGDLKRAGLFEDFKRSFIGQMKAKNEVILDRDQTKYGHFMLEQNEVFCDDGSERSTLSHEISSFLKRNRMTQRMRGSQRNKYRQRNNLKKFGQEKKTWEVKKRRTKSCEKEFDAQLESLAKQDMSSREEERWSKDKQSTTVKVLWVKKLAETRRRHSAGKKKGNVMKRRTRFRKVPIFDILNPHKRMKKMTLRKKNKTQKMINLPAFSRISLSGGLKH
jgi:hypothetical protein